MCSIFISRSVIYFSLHILLVIEPNITQCSKTFFFLSFSSRLHCCMQNKAVFVSNNGVPPYPSLSLSFTIGIEMQRILTRGEELASQPGLSRLLAAKRLGCKVYFRIYINTASQSSLTPSLPFCSVKPAAWF